MTKNILQYHLTLPTDFYIFVLISHNLTAIMITEQHNHTKFQDETRNAWCQSDTNVHPK